MKTSQVLTTISESWLAVQTRDVLRSVETQENGRGLDRKGHGFKNFRRAMHADSNIAKNNPPYENPRSATACNIDITVWDQSYSNMYIAHAVLIMST